MSTPPSPAPRRPLEHELMPYQPLAPDALRPLLVLAPHPDDEVFGCGGLLAVASARRVRAEVVIVSDGGKGGDPALREAESRAAAVLLGRPETPIELDFWRLPDRGLLDEPLLSQRILRTIERSAAQWVVAPSPFEIHPDHRAVCQAAVAAVRAHQAAGHAMQLVFCEVGQPLLPNRLVDISAVGALKARAMRCFASQQAQQAYAEQVEGLNRYRAYTLGSAVTHAEAFWFVDAELVAGGMDALIADVGRCLRLRF